MKRRLAIAWLVLLILQAASIAMAGKRDAAVEGRWTRRSTRACRRRPSSASTPSSQGAMQDKAYPEAIKAIARKIALEGNIQGNKPEEKITRMEAEIAKAPKEMVPVMEAILADWYWHYFQQNRWRFMQRTATAEPAGQGLHHLGPAADLRRDRQAVHQGPVRRGASSRRPRSPSTTTCSKGHLPDSYRPTLYDFLAHEALEFYTSGEQAGAKAEDAFELSADSPIFAPAEEFLKWEVADDRRRLAHAQGDPAVPEPAAVPRERRGQGGLPRRRPGAAELRPQQGRSARRRTPATRRP